jgi:putative transcriptional regulator
MAVHQRQALAEIQIVPGLFFSASKQNLDALVLNADGNLKIFIGHSGWGPGQLDQELKQGAWLTIPSTPEFVFFDSSELWQTVARQIGRSILQSVLNIKYLPDDPSVN